MSSTDLSQCWVREYEARFGAAPGTREAPAELERCVQICQELLQQRESLRAELARTQQERDECLKALSSYIAKELPKLDLDYEALRAQVVREPTLQALIADLEQQEGP